MFRLISVAGRAALQTGEHWHDLATLTSDPSLAPTDALTLFQDSAVPPTAPPLGDSGPPKSKSSPAAPEPGATESRVSAARATARTRRATRARKGTSGEAPDREGRRNDVMTGRVTPGWAERAGSTTERLPHQQPGFVSLLSQEPRRTQIGFPGIAAPQPLHGMSVPAAVPGIPRLQFHRRPRSRPNRALLDLLHAAVDPLDSESGRDARAPTSSGCTDGTRARPAEPRCDTTFGCRVGGRSASQGGMAGPKARGATRLPMLAGPRRRRQSQRQRATAALTPASLSTASSGAGTPTTGRSKDRCPCTTRCAAPWRRATRQNHGHAP